MDRLFERLPESYRALAKALRSTIRSEAPHLRERAMWNNPFWVGKRPVLCLQCYPHHVNFGVMRGAELMARFPRLEGTGKGMRHLRVEDIATARSDEVRAIVREAARLDADG